MPPDKVSGDSDLDMVSGVSCLVASALTPSLVAGLGDGLLADNPIAVASPLELAAVAAAVALQLADARGFLPGP